VFIVIALGSGRGMLIPASVGAIAACLVVAMVGFIVHRPLARVPENTLKFAVGVMLSARAGRTVRRRRSSCPVDRSRRRPRRHSGNSDAERSVGSGRHPLVRLSGSTSFECGKSGQLTELELSSDQVLHCC
jgi:hypothetical protein